MDFTTAVSRTFRVTINGTAYDAPRFLLPEFEQWAADRTKATIERALAQIKEPEKRAQFLLWNSVPPIDVATLADEARSPVGIKFVIDHSLQKANVPDDVREALLLNGNPIALRQLAEILLSAGEGTAVLKEASGDPGGRGDPLPAASAPSAGEPATGTSNAPDLPAPSTATQAA